jgi:O-antigen ligase
VKLTLLALLLLPLALFLGYLSTQYTSSVLLWGLIALAIFIAAFVKVEFGLYILIFSMLLSPEIIAGETRGASLGRGVSLRFEDFLLAVIGVSWFARNAVLKELGLFRKTPLNKAILYYIIACVLSTGFGIITGTVAAKTGFFFVLKYVEYFIVFFMLVNHVETEEQVRRLVFFLFLTCFIVSVIGILQIPAGGRVSAPFEGEVGEPNTFGGYLVLIGAIAGGLILKEKWSRKKQALILLIIFIIPPLLYTQSRTSYLSAIPAVFTLALFSNKRFVVVTLIIFGLILSPFLMPSTVKERIAFTFQQAREAGQIEVGDIRLDTSTSARLLSWKEAFNDWVKKPIFGYGVTGRGFIDAQFPRVLAETGIVGLCAFLFLLFSVGAMAFDSLRQVKSRYFQGLTIGFIAGFVGMLVHSIGANTFIIVRIMEPFWFFAGIITILPMIEQEKAAQLQEI